MIGKVMCPNSLIFFIILIFLFISPHFLLSEDNKQPCDCLDQAIKRIIEIRSLPQKKFLDTLDGRRVLLNEFYDQRGNFMGIAVYMGDGKYCSLPFSGYKK